MANRHLSRSAMRFSLGAGVNLAFTVAEQVIYKGRTQQPPLQGHRQDYLKCQKPKTCRMNRHGAYDGWMPSELMVLRVHLCADGLIWRLRGGFLDSKSKCWVKWNLLSWNSIDVIVKSYSWLNSETDTVHFNWALGIWLLSINFRGAINVLMVEAQLNKPLYLVLDGHLKDWINMNYGAHLGLAKLLNSVALVMFEQNWETAIDWLINWAGMADEELVTFSPVGNLVVNLMCFYVSFMLHGIYVTPWASLLAKLA